MKTVLVTIAAAMVASTTAFAADDGLFDVNDAPANYEERQIQSIDYEPTASNSTSPYAATDLNYEPTENDKLFD